MIDQRQIEEMRRLREDVDRALGKFPLRAQSHTTERHLHDLSQHISPGGGGFGGLTHHDYVIDANYTGTAGATVTGGSGSTSKLYSTLGAAVTDANTNRQTAGQDTTFYIVGGDYTIATEIDCNVPEQSWWHFIGEGKDRVTLTGTVASNGNMIQLNANTLSGRASFSGITFTTAAAETMVNAQVFGYVQVRECRFHMTNGSAVGLVPGRSSSGGLSPVLSVSMTEFTGNANGTGIKSGAGTAFAVGWHIVNCEFDLLNFGIDIDLDLHIYVANSRFDCGTADVVIRGFQPSDDLAFVNCEFEGGGIILDEGSGAVDVSFLSVLGCHFLTSGIDLDQTATTASNCKNWTIVGNVFSNGGFGIRGLNTAGGGPRYSIIVGNTFEGFSANTEIRNCTHATQNIGNVVAFNTTDQTSSSLPVKNTTLEYGPDPPVHTAPKGTPYWDENNNDLYVNNNGSTGWTFIAGTSSVQGHQIREDTSTNFTQRLALNFAETDGVVVADDVPNDQTTVNLMLYAKLAGRAGGQTLIGGTATGNFLDLEGNSVDASSIVRFRQDSVTASTDWVRWLIGAEANPRMAVTFDATATPLVQLGFGAGGATAMDTFIRRSSATITDLRRLSGSSQFRLILTGDTQPQLALLGGSSGGLRVGPGGSTVPNTTLLRAAAGLWSVTNRLRFPEITTPTDSLTDQAVLYARDFGQNTRMFFQDDSLREFGPIGTLVGDFGTFSFPMGAFHIKKLGDSAGYTGSGTLDNPNVSAATSITLGADNVGWLEVYTGSTVPANARLTWPIHFQLSGGVLVYAFRVPSTVAAIRLFIGWTDQTAEVMLASDDPAGNYIGLQYSTARPDTNWQYVCKDGVTQNLQDSGVAAAVTPQILKMLYEPGVGAHCSLFGMSWGQDGSTVDLTTNVPGGTVGLVGGIRNLAGLTISANSAGSPTVITTSAVHGLVSGATVVITGSNSTPSIDGTWRVIDIYSTTAFSIGYLISGNTVANPTVVTVTLPSGATGHAFDATNSVNVATSNSTPSLDGTHTISSPTATTFTVPVNVTVAGTTGRVEMNCSVAGTAGTVVVSKAFRTSFVYEVGTP